ncbi:6524_t:CDS:2 [Paraglomus brasilianum]|uniref:6524_t:CDS:1 n=1 Tax=Paraglomus brasilianum TaxID=144538 RepID=A0A9N9D299_9GLOM|nr:6524_t:CDS:2 [Paraglomus brasilianum]
MSRLKHCDDGPPPERLPLSKHPEEKDSIQLQMYTKSLEMTGNPQRPRFVTQQESVQRRPRTTDLRQRYPGHEIISDIGSLNWKRRGLKQGSKSYAALTDIEIWYRPAP